MAGETVIINGHVISDVENVDKARAIGPDTVFLGGSSDDGQKLKEGTAGLVPVGRLDEHTLEEMKKSFYTKTETAENFYSFSLSADNSTFRVDDKGTPMPSEQVAHIRLLKQGITDPVVWTKDGKTVEATDHLDVSVSDMAYPQAVLKNELAPYTNSLLWNDDYGFTPEVDGNIVHITANKGGSALFFYIAKDLPLDKYYIRVRFTNKATVTKNVAINGNGWFDSIHKSIASGASDYLSIVLNRNKDKDTDHIQFICEDAVIGDKFDVEFQCINISSLTEAYPQYSDSQLKTMLDEHLGYIPAQQSLSIGGLMRIENVYSDDKPWEAGSLLTNVENTDDYIRGTITGGAQGYNSWILRSPKDITGLLNHKVFLKASVKSSVNQYSLGFASSAVLRNIPYLYANFTSDAYGYTNVFSPVQEANTLTLYKKETFAFDATSSGLDLWLALNGYDTDKKKADWCNAHIPFFEGETKICVSVRNSLPIKVTAGAYEDTLTLQAVESLSTSLADSDILVSGDGFVRFKDGRQECWGTFNIPKQTWNQWGNIWAKNVDVSDCSFPLPFKAGTTPVVNATNSKDEYVCMISKVVASNIGITKVSVARATDGAMSDYDIQYHAIGRWK